MKLSKLLTLIKQKAQLNENEFSEVETSFYEIINAKIVKRLGEEFSQNQKQNFLESFKQIDKSQNPKKMTQTLKEAGFNPKKAREYIDIAAKQALKEVVNVIENRLSSSDKEEILGLI